MQGLVSDCFGLDPARQCNARGAAPAFTRALQMEHLRVSPREACDCCSG